MEFKKSSRRWDLQSPWPLLWSPSTSLKKSWLRDWSKSCTSHVASYWNEFPTKILQALLVSQLGITSLLFKMKLVSSGDVTEYRPIYFYESESNWNPISNTLEADRPQYDLHALCVIALPHHSVTSDILRFHSREEKFCALLLFNF